MSRLLIILGSLVWCPLWSQTAVDRLTDLEQRTWQYMLANTPALRQKMSLPLEKVPAFSWDEANQQVGFYQTLLRDLATISPQSLPHQQQLTHAALRHQAQLVVDGQRFYWHRFRGIPYTYPNLTNLQHMIASLPLKNAGQRQHYLRLLDQWATAADNLRANFAGQAERGIRLPKAQIDPIRAYFLSSAAQADQHPLAIGNERLDFLDPAKRQAFQAAVATRIRQRVVPAWSALAASFTEAYRSAAPSAVGADVYPDGDAYYQYCIRLNTGSQRTAADIHAIGLGEVARLKKAMIAIQQELGFAGDFHAFHNQLKQDPRFFAATPAEVEARLMKHHQRMEPKVGQYFSTIPASPAGVARLDPSLEGSMTFGYYQWPTAANPRGTYFFNGSNLAERSLIQAQGLIYHELVPGHHFQLALLHENQSLSMLRRNMFDTANVEGWAEYASGLAHEMGLYTDPYDRYGRLLMDMFISVRLVVDTGMNSLDWSREQASAYMQTHTLRSATEIASETLRYSVAIPGQALAYKMGSLKIRELRQWVQDQQGNEFDIKAFHAAILAPGALPLPILKQHIQATFAQQP